VETIDPTAKTVRGKTLNGNGFQLPDWSLPYVRWLPFINEPGFQRNVALSMGQNMYTPTDISREDLIEDDRPYAGWAYLGIAFHSKNERRLDTMEFQLGIVGPASGAEQAQKVVHRKIDNPRPKATLHLRNSKGLICKLIESEHPSIYFHLTLMHE